MKFAKPLFIGSVIFTLVSAGAWQFYLKEQVGYGKVATAYTAKQICSCRFVSTREMESCKRDFTQDISALKISETYIDATGRTDQSVTASALGLISATATYEPGLGCVLQR